MFEKKQTYEEMSDKQLNERLSANLDAKEQKVSLARVLARWFEIDLKISIFGRVVFEYHWPPQVSSNDDNDDK